MLRNIQNRKWHQNYLFHRLILPGTTLNGVADIVLYLLDRNGPKIQIVKTTSKIPHLKNLLEQVNFGKSNKPAKTFENKLEVLITYSAQQQKPLLTSHDEKDLKNNK